MHTPAVHHPRHPALDTFTSFGTLLLFLRRRAQLRQRELAQAVGYSEAQIGRLENGQRLPDVAAVMAQFVPALELESEPELVERLIELARQARLPTASGTVEIAASTASAMPVEPDKAEAFAVAPPLGGIPPQPTPFLSRAEELASIARLLRTTEHRCLTLLGPGGIGKTRLALEAAARQVTQFADGVYVVALAGVSSVDALVPAIAQALQLPSPRDGDVFTQLQHFLSSKHLMLVLDNIEHLVDGADLLADLLLAAPQVWLLVTSRERLHLRGEIVVEVDGFSVPPAHMQADEIALNEAVALFVSSARRARHDWMPAAEDWPRIATICRLGEGFPLAIELAASWIRMLSCAEIAHELEQTWDVLQTSMRDLPARHRSMRVAFTHSWVLLTPPEQCMLSGLSVFRGSWTREAAAAVLDMSSGTVLPLLGSLADKSMVKRVGVADGSRFLLHEVVRQYAAEHLRATPDQESIVRTRHSHYYLHRLYEREAAIRGAKQHDALAEISADNNNLRAALDWAVAEVDIQTLRRVLPVLLVFIEWRYSAAEGVTIFEQISAALRHTHGGTHAAEHRAVLALALAYNGWCRLFVGRSKEAITLLHEAHALHGDGDDPLVRGDILLFLGYAVGNTGDTAQGRRLIVGSIRAFEACGDEWRVARGLYRLGMLMHQDGAYVRAQHVFAVCLARLEAIGDPRATALTLNRLGVTDALLGRHAHAQQRIQQSLLHSSAAHDRRGIASALFHLGTLAQHHEDDRAARYFFAESLDLFSDLNERGSMADALAQIGYSAVREGDWVEARRVFDDAWQIIRDAEANTTSLSLLVSCAALDLATGRNERAVEALTLALYHSVSEQATRDRAAHLLHQAETRLTPYQYVMAQRRGREASFASFKP